MSFNIYLTSSSKVENSTAQFSTTGLTPYTCTLKDGWSISHPVVKIQIAFTSFANLTRNNVAYIANFRRYYFVTDWRYEGVLAICTLSVDVLASFWNDLKTKSFYVTRSAYKYNIDILDTHYPVTSASRSFSVQSQDNPFQPASGYIGCYVLGIVNQYGSMDGCTQYYAMGDTEFKEFMGKIFTVTNYGTLGTFGDNNDTFTDDLAEVLINPLQYIASIIWLPYTTAEILSTGFVSQTMNVYCGYTSLTLANNVYKFDDATVAKQFTNVITLTIPKHPDNSTATWLSLSPYSEYRFSFYPFGSYSIDPEYLNGKSTLYVLYTVDARTGKAIMNVGTSVNGSSASDWIMPQAFLTVEAQLGVVIPVNTIETNMNTGGQLGQILSGAIMAGATGLFSGLPQKVSNGFYDVASQLSGYNNPVAQFGASVVEKIGDMANNIGQGISDTVGSLVDAVGTFVENSGIGSAFMQLHQSPSFGGSMGVMSLFSRQKVSLAGWFKVRPATDNTHHGKPLCTVETLSGLAGYTICDRAVADISEATFAEKRQIETFLNTGFYIET